MSEEDQQCFLHTKSIAVCTFSPYLSVPDTRANDYYPVTAACLALAQLSIFCYLFPYSFFSTIAAETIYL